jgi:hypothetical protein
MNAAERLTDAHNRVAKAERAHIAATAAAAKAREFATKIEAEHASIVARDQTLAAERATRLKASIKSGAMPVLAILPAAAKERLARIDAEDRQAAARRAVADLNAEQREATATLDDAQRALDLAARLFLIAEIETRHVARIIALEEQITAHRIAVTGLTRSGVGGWDNGLISPRTRSIAAESDNTPIGTTNHPLSKLASEAAEKLRQRQAELMKHPAATPIKDAAA